MIRTFMVPNGTEIMDEVTTDCDEFEGLSMNTLEEIAMRCIMDGKGHLISVALLTKGEIGELMTKGFAYVDLIAFGEEEYMFRIYGLKEIRGNK